MSVLRLIPEQGNEAIAIDQDRVRVGRDPASDVHLRDASVSRRHAEIRKGTDGEWVIIDLDSGNGILIDGVRTPESVLRHGQRLHIGNVAFRVEVDRGDEGSTVILKRSPFAGGPRTTVLAEPPPDLRSAKPPAERPAVLLITALAVSGLVVASFGLLALYWPRPQAPARATAPLPTPLPTAVERAAPSPVPAAPRPAPVVAPPRGALLISTDVRTEVLVDGQRSGGIDAGGLRRIGVVPGDHIVSFLAADARHDQLVHVNASEQSVVRFSGGATSLPSPSPVAVLPQAPALLAPAALRVATLSPMASPSAGSLPATPSPTPVVLSAPPPVPVQEMPDPDLQSGMAATRRGDFFRALLVLKDVARRLDTEPKARRELALAHAYLAWTYHGLGRPADAQAAAERALKANPDFLSGVENFPSEVVSLFRRRR
jgi:FHA domain